MTEVATVKERPILFSGAMVRAILDGRKTQTRRVITDVRGIGRVTEFKASDTPGYDFIMRDRRLLWNDLRRQDLLERCPYGQPGDRLWVRETFVEKSWSDGDCHKTGCPDAKTHPTEVYLGVPMRAIYRVSCTVDIGTKWKPSIHMPRWASRIVLEVVSVRVERVQDISRHDAAAEGVVETWGEFKGFDPKWAVDSLSGWDSSRYDNRTSSENFMYLWDSINAKRGFGWDVNPWVWVVEFKRIETQ